MADLLLRASPLLRCVTLVRTCPVRIWGSAMRLAGADRTVPGRAPPSLSTRPVRARGVGAVLDGDEGSGGMAPFRWRGPFRPTRRSCHNVMALRGESAGVASPGPDAPVGCRACRLPGGRRGWGWRSPAGPVASPVRWAVRRPGPWCDIASPGSFTACVAWWSGGGVQAWPQQVLVAVDAQSAWDGGP
jgi:hypothetical protein